MHKDPVDALKAVIDVQDHDIFTSAELRETPPDPQLGTFYLDCETAAIYYISAVEIHQQSFHYHALEYKATAEDSCAKRATLRAHMLQKLKKLNQSDARDKIYAILKHWTWSHITSSYIQHRMDQPITDTVMERLIHTSRTLLLQDDLHNRDYRGVQSELSREGTWAYSVAQFCLEITAVYKSEPELFADRYFRRRWQYLSGMLINQLTYDGYLRRECIAKVVDQLQEKLAAE